MAKPFTCNTKSPPGNAILGFLFLACALVLIVMPCLGLVGTATGSVTLPKDGHEALGTLCALGICLAMLVAMLALGVLCLNATLLPKTLDVTDDGIELRWFKKRLGSVPFANMKDVIVKTRAMAGQTANGVAAQAMFTGGFIAAMIARSRFDPNEPIGFIIQLKTATDTDTFWPQRFFSKLRGKEIDVPYYWKLPHRKLVDRIGKALARYEEDSGADAD